MGAAVGPGPKDLEYVGEGAFSGDNADDTDSFWDIKL